MNRKVLPPSYLLIAILVMIILHFTLSLYQLIPMPWNFIGLIPLFIGIVINLYADKVLREANTTVKPFQESTTLVTSGVYGFSRHPMYLGFLLVLIGVAVLLGTLSTWIILPIFVVLMEMVFIRVEERMLSNKFGREWEEYKKKVRCWV